MSLVGDVIAYLRTRRVRCAIRSRNGWRACPRQLPASGGAWRASGGKGICLVL